ncbi:hypothetical protein, partial [Photobacterium profundum]|uniref:hypothetical protein n=1 Tax=Photobacterium profundum TaxID=74109 RepID=UPI003D0EC0F3
MLGIRTLLLFDGVSEFSNFKNNKHLKSLGLKNYHPIITDSVAVVGDKAKRYFRERGCEVIKYVPLHVRNDNIIELPDKERFLITTANTAYYDESEFITLVNLIKEVIICLNEKSQTYDFRIFDERIINALDIEPEKNFRDGGFDDVLINYSFVITTPSSISLTCMFHQRPVAHLQYRDYPHFFQTGWSIIPSVPLDQTIDSMISFDQDRMAFQQSEVKSNFTVDPLAKSISSIISSEKFKFKKDDFCESISFKMLDSKFN